MEKDEKEEIDGREAREDSMAPIPEETAPWETEEIPRLLQQALRRVKEIALTAEKEAIERVSAQF